MKKILFASTALIATAGVAAADSANVDLSGYARFGVTFDDSRAKGNETQQENRFRLNITPSIESDNGLTFGARIRIQADDNGQARLNTPRYWVSAGGLRVDVGNAPGAIDSMPGMFAQSLGLTGLGYHNVVANSAVKGFWGFDGYESGAAGREAVTVSYGANDFNVMASYSNTAGEERTALYASYAFSGWTVALGYQDSSNNANDKLVLTAGGKVGIADLDFSIADNDGTMKFGIGADFEVGAATTVSAFVNSEDTAGEAYGIGVRHNLGGGASVRGGVVQTAGGTMLADLGLHFNF